MVFDFKPPKNVNVKMKWMPLEIGIATSTKCPHHAIERKPIIMKFNRRLPKSKYATNLWRGWTFISKANFLKIRTGSVIIRNSKSSVPYLMVLKLLLRGGIHY